MPGYSQHTYLVDRVVGLRRDTCEAHNVSFAACFQPLVGVEQQQCNTIGLGQCAFPTKITTFSPQEAYV